MENVIGAGSMGTIRPTAGKTKKMHEKNQEL